MTAWRFLWTLVGAALMLVSPVSGAKDLRSIAFYYGDDPPVSLLQRFDVAVVEPVKGFRPPVREAGSTTRWLAYVSIGEVAPSRGYMKEMPHSWLIGRNAIWKASIVDQTAPGWPDFLVSKVLKPLWKSGYQGFFLDTLDSYQLLGKDKALLERQRQGLVKVIRRIRRAYPSAMLILNRGFELLPEVHGSVDAVAFESLFKSWDQKTGRYGSVKQEERDWLLARAQEVKAWNLPVIAIDYCPPDNKACILDTAARIRALGIVPFVGDGHLQTVSPLLLPASPGP